MKIGTLLQWFGFSAILLLGLLSQAQQPRQILKGHVRPAVLNGQAKPVGPLAATQRMNLSIVLPLRNQAQLADLLSRLYDPSSPDYHKFLTVAQFVETFGPSAGDYQAVVDYARANGFTVTGRSSNRLVVPVSGTVDQVQKAFNVRMMLYHHPTENRTFFSPDREPSLALSTSIAHIEGLNNFSVPQPTVVRPSAGHAQASESTQGSGPGGSYLGSDMRAAYYGGTALTGAGQTVGLVEFDGYSINDVTSTFDGKATSTTSGTNYVLSYTPQNHGTTYTIPINNVLLDGATGAAASGDDSEEVLDIVQAASMAPGLSQVRAYIGDLDSDILSTIASDDIAQQVSISWLWSPDDPAVDDIFFEEMAAQGQSVFAASGDNGAYASLVSPMSYPAEIHT